jgi:membrane protease YdiL (CAAX protease family)
MNWELVKVNPNWREDDQRVRAQGQRSWRVIVLSVSLFTLVLFVISFIYQPSWSLWGAIRTIFAPLYYLGLSFWLVIRINRFDGKHALSQLDILFGLRFNRFAFNVLVGGLAGGVLGLSFFVLSSYLLPNGITFGPFASINIIFAIFFQLLLSAFGEEFLLRGVAYTSLHERGQQPIEKTLILISLVNLLIYVIQVARFIGTSYSIWLAIFRFTFGLIATVLRYRQDTTVSSITCNLIFNSLVASILPW